MALTPTILMDLEGGLAKQFRPSGTVALHAQGVEASRRSVTEAPSHREPISQ